VVLDFFGLPPLAPFARAASLFDSDLAAPPFLPNSAIQRRLP
jgi:hypothetical protein